MNKANPIRLAAIVAAFVISIYLLFPSKSIDISVNNGGDSVANITVKQNSGKYTTKEYKVFCPQEGIIGETENLTCELQDNDGNTLKKDINIGLGYSSGSMLNFGSELPSFSLTEGKVKKGTIYNFSFVVEYMNLGLDLVGGSELVYQIPKPSGNAEDLTNVELNDVLNIVKKKLNGNGMKEIYIQPVGNDRLLIQLPGLKKEAVEKIKKDISTQGQLEFSTVITDESIVNRARKYIERGMKLPLPNFKYKFVYKYELNSSQVPIAIKGSEQLIESNITVTGKDIIHSYKAVDNQSLKGGFAIHIKFNGKGTKYFGQLTEKSVGKALAIILDNDLVSYPNVNEPILTGECQITGSFSKEEADSLVTVLRSGSMDVKLKLLSENTVGPTLGADSIQSGILATMIGGIAVLLFMLIYYKTLGFIACIALVLNLLMLLAAMIFGGGTLTLPGIAGFALTIGMAVDATVLIFERLREESVVEKQNIKASLTKGYDRAFITIFDSNITTFITALILYLVGNSGPVKGFCLSLMLGLMINLFAAVFVTQTLIAWAVTNKKIKSFNMMGNISIKAIDFFAIGKKVRLISYLILVTGCGFMISKGSNILDVDFTGGNLLQVDLLEPVSPKEMRAICKKAGYAKATVQNFGDVDNLSYTIRTKLLEDETKIKFHQFLQSSDSGLKLSTDTSLAFPRDITVGGVAAKEMLIYAFVALFAAMLVILLYIMMRFSEFKYGFGACIALVHDISITLSVLFILDQQINLTIFAAVLTVIGYSLNDTIVIFDRIRENIGQQKNYDFRTIAIKSLNQTLKRTVLTSITTLFVISALVISGGGVIKGFAITMLIGLISGTYSSLFIATPYVLHLYNKQKKLNDSSDNNSNDLAPVNTGSV
jgi:SecD/SecF fusion protein